MPIHSIALGPSPNEFKVILNTSCNDLNVSFSLVATATTTQDQQELADNGEAWYDLNEAYKREGKSSDKNL